MSKVAVIGGCGRLGFKLSLICANKGHQVFIIDLDEERLSEVRLGNLPFVEKDAKVLLENAQDKKLLSLSSENDGVMNAEIVIITIGTPVDSNLNPSLEPVAGVIFDIAGLLKEKQLVIFRNTISPQVVQRIKTLIEDKTGFKVGQDIYLAFAPELLSENTTVQDLSDAPQPIGTFDEKSFEVAKKFFESITKGKIHSMTPEETQLAKLMYNMQSYIQAATVNEFYLIAENYGANIHKINEALGTNFPTPSLNAVGAGPHKEGWFLVERLPFAELVTTAFKINESMVNHMIRKLENYKIKKVAILGMASKPNSDETSSSLSYKLRKALYYKEYEVACYDPYLPEYSDSVTLADADAVILMTHHKKFQDLEEVKYLVNNPNCVYFDIGGFWKETREHGKNGILQLTEVKDEKIKAKVKEKRKK